MRLLTFIFLWQLSMLASAQISGKVTLAHAGVEFTIPEGWVGQQNEMGYILGSQTEAGAIFLSGHQSRSIEALKQEATNGIYDEELRLAIEGAPDMLQPNSIGASYSGWLQGQAVKAYAVGLINPNGQGISILVLTTPEMFTERHRQLATEIATSIRFFEAERSPLLDEWKKALSNARLTYMDSYSTQGGGYSDKIVIDLCAAGYFRHSKNYQMGVDVGGAFGSDNSNSQGAGSWDVVQNAGGNPVLQLKFNRGEIKEYTLQYADEKTLLNGTRYFRTYDAGCR